MDRAYDTFHEVLVKLFNEIMDIEAKAIITPEYQDITNNDMHVIEAIGIGEPRNMSSVAKTLSVTVGTLTIAINNLVKKGYVHRVRSGEDRRGKENGRGKSKGTGTEKKKVRRTEEETGFPRKDRSCRRNCFDRTPHSSGAGS